MESLKKRNESGDRNNGSVEMDANDAALFGPNRARDTEMAQMRAMGWTYRALGARYGLTKSGIEAALRRFRQPRDRQFGLSMKAFNAVRISIGADTGDFGPLKLAVIASYSYCELLDMPNLGLISAREIATMLWRRGIKIDELPARLELEFQREDQSEACREAEE